MTNWKVNGKRTHCHFRMSTFFLSLHFRTITLSAGTLISSYGHSLPKSIFVRHSFWFCYVVIFGVRKWFCSKKSWPEVVYNLKKKMASDQQTWTASATVQMFYDHKSSRFTFTHGKTMIHIWCEAVVCVLIFICDLALTCSQPHRLASVHLSLACACERFVSHSIWNRKMVFKVKEIHSQNGWRQ